MAENLYKRQTAGDAKWLSALARLNRRGGHGDISNEVVIGDDWKEAIAKLLWALSQLQRGCQNPVLGLRAQCWAPEIGETFSGLNPLIPSNETNELLKPNHTYYVRTRRGTAITLWLPDATDSDGEVIEVKDADGSADTKNITIKTTKGQTIDGASTFTISASYGSAQLRSNGQQWYTVARTNASEGLSGLEVTQTTASTADNKLYRTDRPSSDNRVAQTTGITCDDSNNLSGIGTLASGAHTETVANVTASNRSGVDSTKGPWRQTYFKDMTTSGGGVQTVMDVPIPTSCSATIAVRLYTIAPSSLNRVFLAVHELHVSDNAGTPTIQLDQPVIDNDPGGIGYAISFIVSTTNVRIQINDATNTLRLGCSATIEWRNATV